MILVIIFKAIVFWLAVGSAVWEQTLSSEDKHSDFFTLLMFLVKTGFLFFGPLCDCIVMVWWKHYVTCPASAFFLHYHCYEMGSTRSMNFFQEIWFLNSLKKLVLVFLELGSELVGTVG